MSLLAFFTKGGPIAKDEFLQTLNADPATAKAVDAATGNTALHFVCCNGAPRDLVEPLLRANPAAAATADLDGFLPLVGALSCGAPSEVVDLILNANPGAAKIKVDGRTPLHYAVSHGCDVSVARALVRIWPDACGIRDADGNAPLHFALIRCAAPAVVDVLVRARPGACAQRGFLGRLPLELARLYGAAGTTLEVLTDAFTPPPTERPAITQPPRRRPSKRKGASAARRPAEKLARTVTPDDMCNVIPPFEKDYALGEGYSGSDLGAGYSWLDEIFDESQAVVPTYEESLDHLGLEEVKARCAAAGLDTTVRKTDGEPGKGRFKRVLVARLLASAAARPATPPMRDVSPDESPRAVACA